MTATPVIAFEISNKETPRHSTRFRRTEQVYDVSLTHNFNEITDILSIANEINKAYERMMKPLLSALEPDDFYSVYIIHKDLKSKPIFIPTKKVSEFDNNEFLNSVYKVSQSNSSFLFNSLLKITVAVSKNIKGSGWRGRTTLLPRSTDPARKVSHCIIEIKNKDVLCGFRAIYVSKKYHELSEMTDLKKKRNEWCSVKGRFDLKQKKGAQEICMAIGLSISEPLSSINFGKVQEYLSKENYQFIVVDRENSSNLLYKGPSFQKQIFIEYDNGHFNAIVNMSNYLEKAYYCVGCNIGHSTEFHKCDNLCNLCLAAPPCEREVLIDCEHCFRTFLSQKCFDNHKVKLCVKLKKCSKCELEYDTTDKKHKHVCDQSKCKTCSEVYSVAPHYCSLKPLNPYRLFKEDETPKFIVTYDIESAQYCASEGLSQHKPILLICEIVCDKCWDVENKCKSCDVCDFCGIGYKEFYEENCIKSFGDYLYYELVKKAIEKKANILAYAHNSKGYDGHFIFTDLFNRGFDSKNIRIILQGRKILKLDVSCIRFIDSLSLFQLPLASLPKAFGIEDIVVKGHFPHLFTKEENLGHVGALPEIEYYGVKYMKKSAANKLRQWHAEESQKQLTFNFKDELHKYCRNDVKILTMSIMLFRKLTESVTKFDPVTRNFTLAGIAMEDFRANVLKQNTIGITPIKGYTSNRNRSVSANLWLDFKEKEYKKEILREQKFGKYYSDGYITSLKLIFEFFGCHFHGCLCNENRDTPLADRSNKSYKDLYDETQVKLEYYKRRGFTVESKWECDYRFEKASDNSLKTFVSKRSKYYEKIAKFGGACIRDSFFGGRTNNFIFTHECAPGEKGRYVDFTSLYPAVLVKGQYPVLHPTVLTDFENNDINNYFGFIKCVMLPPKKLYLGVLPARVNKKLYFPLCRKCAEIQNQASCTHSDSDRCLVGTWTSIELQKAVSVGYEIIDIIEVLHYEQKSADIFKPYITKWLKIKTQCSGWPSSCGSDVEKQEAFIKMCKIKDDLDLEIDQMFPNEGLRFIAKLLLNSLWGKLAQRPNLSQTTMCTDYSQYHKIISDAKVKITGELLVTDDVLLVSSEYIDDTYDAPRNTSVAVASFVTAHARLALYNEMEKLEAHCPGSAWYCDTDSILFCQKEGSEYEPQLGDFLGEFTDQILKEYKDPDAYITAFASSGPKNYGYKVRLSDGSIKSTIKVKGICLTDEVDDQLNFESLFGFAQDYSNGIKRSMPVNQQQFRCDARHNVYTAIFDKTYRVVSEKRRILGNKTLPFGYVDN